MLEMVSLELSYGLRVLCIELGLLGCQLRVQVCLFRGVRNLLLASPGRARYALGGYGYGV